MEAYREKSSFQGHSKVERIKLAKRVIAVDWGDPNKIFSSDIKDTCASEKGGGGTEVEGVGPFSTSKVIASPHGT